MGLTIYALKPRFQALLRGMVGRFARGGITPNQVTIAAAILSIGGGAALLVEPTRRGALLTLPLLLLARMALNAIDGMLAREHDMRTPGGAILNELGDVVSDAVLYLPLLVVAGADAIAAGCAVGSMITAELAGILGLTIGASRRYDGPFGKSDRAFAMSVVALVVAVRPLPDSAASLLAWIATALGAVTIVVRSRRALAEVRAP